MSYYPMNLNMNMELKCIDLNDILAYLPYGLYAERLDYFVDFSGNRFDEIVGVNKYDDLWYVERKDGIKSDILSTRPLLFPISCLTQYISISKVNNGEPFIPIVELLKQLHSDWWQEYQGTRYIEITYDDSPFKTYSCFKYMATKDLVIHKNMPLNHPYWLTQKLNEWYIDYRGLIEKGLALDVTCLESNPYYS